MEKIFEHGALVGILLACTGIVFILSIVGLLLRRPRLNRIGFWIFCGAFVVNTLIIASRWIEAERAPFKTLYETLLFYPWCISVVTFLLIGLYRLYVLLPFASATSIVGLTYALIRPDVEIVNMPPALQSGWFVPHVVTYFIAYAALFASCVLAVLALISSKRLGKDLEEPLLESEQGFPLYTHRAVMFGFSTLTLGLVMGALWGKVAWGDYWSWDPKENWALVTWLAYLIYLHLRLVKGWRGRRAMVVCILAFVAVVFTYLGINLLPTASESIHVYQ